MVFYSPVLSADPREDHPGRGYGRTHDDDIEANRGRGHEEEHISTPDPGSAVIDAGHDPVTNLQPQAPEAEPSVGGAGPEIGRNDRVDHDHSHGPPDRNRGLPDTDRRPTGGQDVLDPGQGRGPAHGQPDRGHDFLDRPIPPRPATVHKDRHDKNLESELLGPDDSHDFPSTLSLALEDLNVRTLTPTIEPLPAWSPEGKFTAVVSPDNSGTNPLTTSASGILPTAFSLPQPDSLTASSPQKTLDKLIESLRSYPDPERKGHPFFEYVTASTNSQRIQRLLAMLNEAVGQLDRPIRPENLRRGNPAGASEGPSTPKETSARRTNGSQGGTS